MTNLRDDQQPTRQSEAGSDNSKVKIAPCTARGKVTGPEFSGVARILPPQDGPAARKAINRKYFMARMPIWWRTIPILKLTSPVILLQLIINIGFLYRAALARCAVPC